MVFDFWPARLEIISAIWVVVFWLLLEICIEAANNHDAAGKTPQARSCGQGFLYSARLKIVFRVFWFWALCGVEKRHSPVELFFSSKRIPLKTKRNPSKNRN